jgi:LuxR family quorum sensing-dependent transcriptional regulator
MRDGLEISLEVVDGAQTLQDLGAKTLRVIRDFGLTATASGIIAGAKAATASHFHFAHWPPDLLARYLREDLQAVDPVRRWARASGKPASFSQIAQRLGPKDPGNKVLQIAAEFGITEGMCIPMRGADGAIGLVSFSGRRPGFTAAEFRALLCIGTIVFRAAERIDPSVETAHAAPVLTLREIELLPLLVHGHNDREIGELAAISEATVRFHLKNVRDKIGAVSRTHLAAKAVALGFVSL